MADHLDRYRQQTAELIPQCGEHDEDVFAALVEAERTLRSAERQLRRAASLSS
jgi:hypothetical protein